MIGRYQMEVRDADPDWREYANCKGIDASVFFLDWGSTTDQAKSICATCPVQVECLEYAVMTNQNYGVWGGLTEPERRKIRHERRRAGVIR